MKAKKPKTKHTPGPWRALQLNWGWQILPVSVKTRNVIGTVGSRETYPQDDTEGEANAQIMAAAPELYTFAKYALAWLIQADPEDAPAIGEVVDGLRSAIAKAEGGEP